VSAKLSVRPRLGEEDSPVHRKIGDAAFDREFVLTCFSPNVAEALLSEKVRLWLLALRKVRVIVKGTVAEVQIAGVENDLDRLRGALEQAVELARAWT